MDEKIGTRFDQITEAAGGTVRCPVCHKDEWTFGEDSIYRLDGLSIQRHRRLAAEDAGEVEEEPIPDEDIRTAFCVTAACRSCGFVRLHLTDLRDM